jgi:hypothetical protein
MACEDYKHLNKFVTQIGDTLLTSQLESNLKTFLDWGLLEIGGFFNITIPTSGAYGGTFDRLRAVDDPAYSDGQVWEGARKDWVWETGLEYATQPIDISGVYVGGTFYGTGHATYGHHYNYPLGRVIFDSAISQNSTVQMNHSYRHVQIYIADQAPWWDEFQQDSFRVDNSTFHEIGSGQWGILANHRVQLPAIVIEAVPRRNFRPYELGTIGNYVYQDVLFNIIAESRWWRNKLVDITSLEKDHTIWLYDNNLIATATGYPLDHRGMRVGSLRYPDFVDDYRFKKARFFNTDVSEMTSLNSRLHKGIVRATFEIIMA